MSDFGDIEPDDAYDHEPADPEQVAMRLHRFRSELEELIGNGKLPPFHTLDLAEQTRLISVATREVDWLATHAADALALAIAVHEYRRTQDPTLDEWDDLSDDHKELAIELMRLVINWLRREGAIT